MLLTAAPEPVLLTRSQQALEEINQLEQQMFHAGHDDACLWRQAELVAEQLQTMTQRAVAAHWINPRVGKPYTHKHVWSVAHVFGEYGRQDPKPLFRTVYNKVKRWGPTMESPRTPIVAPPEPPPVEPKLSRAAIEARRVRCRELAGQGYTVAQIAEMLTVCADTVNNYAKSGGYEITARRMGKTRRHDSNRIVAQMAMDAENLTADVNLITFGDLHRHRLAEWIASFVHSCAELQHFIRKLKEAAQ